MTLITGNAKIAAVLGWPIKHSRSPLLHNFWLQRYQIDGAYIPLAVKPEDFKVVIQGMVAAGFKGCNVTIPHKEAAYKCCDILDDIAKKTGSVNTLVFQEDGKIFGTSTDGAGFVASLKDQGVQLKGCSALVLGAGGAARSVVASLLEEKVSITLANRTVKRAHNLIADMGEGAVIDWQDWSDKLGLFDLLVNTTSLGMEEKESYHFDLSRASSHLVVTDIVYVPRQTALLKIAHKQGLKTVEGLGMLLHQARFGFKKWFGIDPVVDQELTEFIARSLVK